MDQQYKLNFKKGIKIIVTDEKGIRTLKLPDQKVGVISFFPEAVPERFKTEGNFLPVEINMDIVFNRYHDDCFRVQDEAADKINKQLEKWGDMDVIVYQCQSAELRSVAAACAWITVDSKEGVDIKRWTKGDKFVEMQESEWSHAGCSGLGRFQHFCMDAVHDATFNNQGERNE